MVKIVADNDEKVLVDPALVLQINGRDGKDGERGQDGLPGRDGVDGRDGKDGKDGRDGIDGKKGVSSWIEYDKKTNTLSFKNDGGLKTPDPIKLPAEAKGWGFGAGGVTAQSNYDEKNKNAVDFIKNKPQVEEMPEANKKNLGKIVQYIGADAGYYQHGYVYECFEKDDHTFGWKRIDIQPGGSRGRFLSLWNSKTGLAETNPPYSPYEYQTGDFFIVGTVDETTNYKPSGTEYVEDTASTTVETEDIAVDDTYYFDGTFWKLQHNEEAKVKDVQIDSTSIVSSGVATIPIGAKDVLGVFKLYSSSYGLQADATGGLAIKNATSTDITGKTSVYRPLTPSNIDEAVKVGLTTNTLTLTTSEQSTACDWLGALYNKSTANKTLTIAGSNVTTDYGTNVGYGSFCGGYSVAVGANAQSGWGGVCIGSDAKPQSGGTAAILIGKSATCSNARYSIALGYEAQTGGNGAIQIGYGTNSEAMTLCIGFYDYSTPANSVNYKLLGTDGIIPTDRRIKVQALSATDSITLADNTIYNGGTQTALTIALPATATNSFTSEIDFTSDSTPTILTYPNTINWIGSPDDIVANDFIPQSNKRYSCMFWYDGVNYNCVVKGV